MRVVRIATAAVVLVMAGVLVWHVTHQDDAAAKAIVHGRVVAAPAFHLSRLGGGAPVVLAAYRGRAVVVNFWASDCIPCKQEMPRLQAASQRWAARPVSVVGIDVLDSRGAARAFAREHGVTYAIGVDPVGDVANTYGVAYTPTTFFIDRRGRIVKRVLGPVSNAVLDAQIDHALAS